jgi:thiamine kinase-like enzyme
MGIRLAEAESSEFVRQNTQIPIPKVFLVFCINHYTHIVSQFIKGQPLCAHWPTLSDARKEEVGATISSYVRQMQMIQPAASCPGPVIPSVPWRGRWFIHDLEPLESHTALVDWLNHKGDVTKRFHPTVNIPSLSSNYPLVFTHGDIAPRNFIMDSNNVLWLIDFDRAGWYPAYMEYATIAVEIDPFLQQVEGIEEWVQFVLRGIENYDKELKILRLIDWALQTAPMA